MLFYPTFYVNYYFVIIPSGIVITVLGVLWLKI